MALAFATIERPHVAQRFIASARRYFPEMPIYVADQSLSVASMRSFYSEMDVALIRMPYDAGVCASRNRLVSSIEEEHFILCDDDFVFGKNTDFADALRILDRHPDIGIVGGKLYDYFDGGAEHTRHWELYLHLDTSHRTLTSVPIYHYAPQVSRLGNTQYYLCDAVMNFAVMRRSIFDQPAIRWDERFKSNGEHEDFYLNLKSNSAIGVAYLPTMIAYHHHPEVFQLYRSQLRDRQDGWKRFFDKWDIDQHLEIGLGVRTRHELDTFTSAEETRDRFFLNDNLSLRGRRDAEVLLVGPEANLQIVGMLKKDGSRRAPKSSLARLVIRTTGVVAAAAVDTNANAELMEPNLGESAEGRHSFTPPGDPCDPSEVTNPLMFRYNPVERPDADFLIWCRAQVGGLNDQEQTDRARILATHVRWFADDGRVLMWEGNRNDVDICRSNYWVPMLVDVPVRPENSAYLRFEIVGGDGAARRPLCVGFLFRRNSDGSMQDRNPSEFKLDVLALNPWNAMHRRDPSSTMLSKSIFPKWGGSLAGGRCPGVDGLTLLQIGSIGALDSVLMFGRGDAGGPLWAINRHYIGDTDGVAPVPLQVAIPSQALRGIRIIGVSENREYMEISTQLTTSLYQS